MFVDERANPAQQLALVAMATELSNGIVGTIVQRHRRRRFSSPTTATTIHVAAGQVALDVNKHLTHDPTCGAMQWFHPLVVGRRRDDGRGRQHAFSGSALGTKWSDPNKRSAFFGTFSY